MSETFTNMNMVGADVWYCPDFFENDHKIWYYMIDNSVEWKQFEVMVYGKIRKQPRDSFYMADDGYPYKYSGVDRKPVDWTTSVNEIKKRLNTSIQKFKPGHPPINACLGNRYKNGKHCIGNHSDSENDIDKNAYIISVSLGAERDFVFTHKKTKEKKTIKLKSGSVLLMGGDCQKNWTHGLPKRLRVEDSRINLTMRSIISRQ